MMTMEKTDKADKKQAREKKKAALAAIAVQMRRSQNQKAFWQVTLEQTDNIVIELDKRIAFLQARKGKLLNDLSIAPERLASATREIQRLAKLLHQPVDLQAKVEKALKIAMQLSMLQEQLKDCDLTSEQFASLTKSMGGLKLGDNS